MSIPPNSSTAEESPSSASFRSIPCCSACQKTLLEPMRATCQECGAVVCRRDAACRRAHSRQHLVDYYDKRAHALSQRGTVTKPRKG